MSKTMNAAAQHAFVFIALFVSAASVQLQANPSTGDRPVRHAKLEKVAAELAASLEIHKRFQVLIVPENDRIVSVDPFVSGEGYRVEFERAFFDQLNEEELTAALAHEIGHVWIFAHPQYHQTEALANKIALKVVSRKPLETLYSKLWTYTNVAGTLADLLEGEE